MKKKLLTALIALIACVVALPTTVFAAEKTTTARAETVTAAEITPEYDWYGDGTAAEFTVGTVAELAGLAKLTQGSVTGITSGAVTFADKTVQLGANIAFADDQYWYYNDGNGTVYNYQIVDFAGTFDGDIYTITGLKFYKMQKAQFNLGLFAAVAKTGYVKNVTLSGVSANTSGGWGTQTRIGSIACKLYGKAEACHVDGVEYTVDGYLDSSGGMFGGVHDSAVVKDSTVKNVSIVITGSDNGQYVGGFVGSLSSSTESTTISNCSVEDVFFDCAYKLKRFGGFVGYSNKTTLTDCTATNINFDVDDYVYVTGGFIGMAAESSSFNNCDVHGVTMNLSRETTGPTRVGGFCGTVSNGNGTTSSFVGCDVTDLDITMNVKVQSDIGGFLGYSDAAAYIEGCTVVGKMDATNTSDDSAAVGGFIGSTTKSITIKNSSADVDIKANVDAGGFAGDASNLTIEDSEALGDVTSINGSAGGFAGITEGNTSLTDCEATGSVASANGVAGGLVGYVGPSANFSVAGDCVPSKEVSGSVTSSVANSQDTYYEIDLEGNISATTPDYLCYGTFGNAKVGFDSVQKAIDAGASEVTLLAAVSKDLLFDRAEDSEIAFTLGDFTLTSTITVMRSATITVSGTSAANSVILTEPYKDHYTFNGWYKDTGEAAGKAADDSGWVAEAGYTYTAQWAVSAFKPLDASELNRDFGSMKYGYGVPAAQTIEFVYLGSVVEEGRIVGVVTSADYFSLTYERLVLTVTPKPLLNVGAYEETVHVRMGDGSTHGVTAKIVVEAKDIASATIELGAALTYNGESQTQSVASVKIDGVDVTYVVSDDEQTNAGDYELTVTGTGNFTGTAHAAWNVAKATAEISVGTTEIVKTYGDVWSLPTAMTTFGSIVVDKTVAQMENAGTYTVTYSVTGTSNFDGDSQQISVTVRKADPTFVLPRDLEGVSGSAIGSVALSGGFAWKNASATIVCGENSYEIVYTPDDAANYNVITTEAVVNGLHVYGEASYVWSEDYGACTATRVCVHNAEHIERVEGAVETEITQAQACEAEELTTYTAKFEGSAYETQVKEDVVTKAAAGHSYDNACDGDCNVCDGLREPSAHVYDEDFFCEECGYEKYVAPNWTMIGGVFAPVAVLAVLGLAIVWIKRENL